MIFGLSIETELQSFAWWEAKVPQIPPQDYDRRLLAVEVEGVDVAGGGAGADDSVSYNRGKHSLKFGGNIIQRQVDFFQGDYRSKGFFNIAGQGSDYTGYEVSELLAAFVDNYSIANPLGYYHTRSWENG